MAAREQDRELAIAQRCVRALGEVDRYAAGRIVCYLAARYVPAVQNATEGAVGDELAHPEPAHPTANGEAAHG